MGREATMKPVTTMPQIKLLHMYGLDNLLMEGSNMPFPGHQDVEAPGLRTRKKCTR